MIDSTTEGLPLEFLKIIKGENARLVQRIEKMTNLVTIVNEEMSKLSTLNDALFEHTENVQNICENVQNICEDVQNIDETM